MPLYKQVLLTSVKSTPREVARAFEEVAKLIVQNGGVLRATENRGVKRLGYGIFDRRWGELQKHYEAKLIVNQFTASPMVLDEVEQKLKNSQPVIRFETFKIRDPVDRLMNTRKSMDQVRDEAMRLINKSKQIVEQLEKQRLEAPHFGDDEEDVDAKDGQQQDTKEGEAEEEEWRVPKDYEPTFGGLNKEEVDPVEEIVSKVSREHMRREDRYIPEWQRDVFYEPAPPEYPDEDVDVKSKKKTPKK